jgi:hypothetical protein
MWGPLVALHERKSRRANVPERGGLYGLVPVTTTPSQAIANVVAFVGQYTTVRIPFGAVAKLVGIGWRSLRVHQPK